MEKRTSYTGPERRIHKIYVTENTEYHVRRGVCVAVRPRTPHAGWVEGNRAVRMRLEGHFRPGTAMPTIGLPQVGFRLYFAGAGHDIITSPLVAIVRPPKEDVAQYPVDG
jgi:hypothetical protein